MKIKFLSLMDITKKKAAVALLCGALVTVTCAGTVFAAGSRTSIQIKMENGVKTYSTDGGKTWSNTLPTGITINEDGKIRGVIANLSKDADGKRMSLKIKEADGKSLHVKMENGIKSYSTDDGKTWSEKAPEGLTIGEGDIMGHTNGIAAKDAFRANLAVKMVNGVRTYSTDGGKTWSENFPDGVTIDEGGKISHMIGNLPKDAVGKSLLIKVENGVRSYSTDGGKTWSEKAPDDVFIGEDDMISDTVDSSSEEAI